METYYQTLSTIHEIVKSEPSPHTYLCTPHQIILRQNIDWMAIERHLTMLAAEQLITIKQLDKMTICITPSGIAKAKSYQSFANNNPAFQEDNLNQVK